MRPPRVDPFTHRRVLPMGALLVSLALAIGLSYWLVPEQNQVVERLIKDHQYARLQEALTNIGSKLSPSEIRKLSGDDLTTLTTLARLTPRERLNVIFINSKTTYNDYIHGMVLADIRYIDVIKPADAWSLVKAHRTRMNNEQFIQCCTVLAHNAFAISQPGLAAEMFSLACELPESSAQNAQELAVAYRWSGQPLRGSQQLRLWLQRHANEVSKPDFTSLSELSSALAVEGGDASLALDIVADQINRVPITEPPPSLLARALSYALQCQRTAVPLPWLRRSIAAQPEARWTLKALHDAAPDRTKDYQQQLTMLAQIADWNSEFDLAFEQHLRLAAMHHLESLERCVALSDFLGRDDETVEALLLVGDVPEMPELQLTLANMLASLGRDNEAQPLYEQWLKTHPDDRNVAYALACLLEDEGDEDKAMIAFAALVNRHPGDVPAVKKLAENYIRADRHHDALQLYQTLREQDHDHYTRENFTMLAESLDDHPTLLAAQLLVARHDNTTEAWLNIAETATYLVDKAPALVAMQEGLVRQPNSHGLRMAIAQIHSDNNEVEEAVAVLLHHSVKQHQSAMEALLHLAPEARNSNAILSFIGNDVEKRFALSVQARLDLAMLCHFGNEGARSEQLFISVPAKVEHQLAIAEARFTTGGFDEAAQAMNDYLKVNPRAASDDWVLLGDIYDAMGREDDAKQAYAHSLTILTTDLAVSRTTSSLTRPPTKPPSLPTP